MNINEVRCRLTCFGTEVPEKRDFANTTSSTHVSYRITREGERERERERYMYLCTCTSLLFILLKAYYSSVYRKC